ncbi:MAG: hypothetical protein GX428_11290 [Candidatus Atribacteria bacterium]|nr:hypothetical protein [Candidatus Atribacteria bacterium]
MKIYNEGNKNFSFTQTIFHNLAKVRDIEPMLTGYGKGSFGVIKARKKRSLANLPSSW